MVAAYATLPSDSGAHLKIAGSGDREYVGRLKEQLKHHSVEWLGQVAPNTFYNQVDCVIVPSRWHEPQALVIGEALRRGRVIIASDRGGNTEVLAPREGHLLYDPDTEGALGNAMREVLKSKYSPEPEALSPDFFPRIEGILRGASSMLKEG